MSEPTGPLELLRSIINSSIDIVQQDLANHGDPPLDLTTRVRHPQRDRYSAKVNRALKCISSAGTMLKAVCDPEGLMHDIMFNFHDLTALFVVSQANIVNILHERDCHIKELARKTSIDQEKLSSCMQALCNLHIFQEVAPDFYANNELSLLFYSESRRALVGLCADESRLSSCKVWEALSSNQRQNGSSQKSGFHLAYDTDLDIYEWWQKVRPDLGVRGAIAFTGKGLNLEQYISLYSWAEERKGALVVDVGGGAGGATLPVMRKYSHLHLQVQDRPETKKSFEEFLHADYPDVARSGRATFIAQDFFKPQTAQGADVYFLRHILHNWNDILACKILKNLTVAMSMNSKVLVCEHILVPVYASQQARNEAEESTAFFAPEPLLANWGASFTSRLDMQVLAILNARQRTKADFEKLFVSAGLQINQIWRNMGDETIFECMLLS